MEEKEIKKEVDFEKLLDQRIQEAIEQSAATGAYLGLLPKERIAAIPQELINQYAANGGKLSCLSKEQIAAIPQDIINKRAADLGCNFDLELLSAGQIAAIPQEILKPSEEAKKAVILYGTGKISFDQLPPSVLANRTTRRKVVELACSKMRRAYNEICKENGYTENVPQSVVDAFKSQIEAMEKDVEELKNKAIEQLTNKAKEEAKKQEAETIESIGKLRW